MTTPHVSEPEDRVILSPSDRYANVGKTGSGKTTFTTVLTTILVTAQMVAAGWQVWWLDTKGDPKDVARLQKLGYVDGDVSSGLPRNRPMFRREEPHGHLLFRIRRRPDLPINDQAQHLMRLAHTRRRVLVVVDEYTQVIYGPRSAGDALDDIEVTGRGLGVGLLGNTQEPVNVPRRLLSQATHLNVFDLSYPLDIDYMRKFVAPYGRPPRHERHAFWSVWLDGDALPRYYPTLRAWRSRVVQEDG